MNLFLALFWLICALVLLAYENFLGGERFQIHIGRFSFPGVWLMFALMFYNLVRWWGYRSYRKAQRAAEIAHAKGEWEKQRRRSPAAAQPPDPNFNFTEEPPPPPRSITDRPPSNN